MPAMDALGDPVRRRLVEVAAAGPRSAGDLAAVARAEFGISQPATSRHLRVLREAGVLAVEPRGAQRLYAVREDTLDDVAGWLDDLRAAWRQRLDALGTEVARGRRGARRHDDRDDHDRDDHDRDDHDRDDPARHGDEPHDDERRDHERNGEGERR